MEKKIRGSGEAGKQSRAIAESDTVTTGTVDTVSSSPRVQPQGLRRGSATGLEWFTVRNFALSPTLSTESSTQADVKILSFLVRIYNRLPLPPGQYRACLGSLLERNNLIKTQSFAKTAAEVYTRKSHQATRGVSFTCPTASRTHVSLSARPGAHHTDEKLMPNQDHY